MSSDPFDKTLPIWLTLRAATGLDVPLILRAFFRAVGPPEPDGRVEIVLPDGTVVRAPETISAAALRRVLAALRG